MTDTCDIKAHAEQVYKMMGENQYCVQIIVTPKHGKSFASIMATNKLMLSNKEVTSILDSIRKAVRND